MAETIVSWKVYELTKSPFSLGIIGISEALPFIVATVFSGYAADRFNRKKIAQVAMFCLTASFVGIAWLLPNLQLGELGYIYFLIGLGGIARGFMAPSVQSILPNLLPREVYANAAVWSSNVWQSAAVAGPAAGGLLYAWWGIGNSMWFSILLMFLALVVFSGINVPANEHQAIKKEGILESLPMGIRFVVSNQVIFGAILLDLLAVLFGGAAAVLPVFAKEVLHTGPEGLGLMRATPFLGSVVMGLFLAFYPPKRHAGKILLISVFAFGLCWMAFAFSTHLYLSLLLLFLTGVFDCVSVVIRHTVLQLNTPDHMRGRVSAINSIFISSSNEIGAFESGFAASYLGLVNSVVAGSAITLLSVLWVGYRFPKLRNHHTRP